MHCASVILTLAVVVIVLVVDSTWAQINHDLFEGDPCRFPNGVRGVCRRAKQCPGFRPRGNPVICSFLGTGPRSEAVVCCAGNQQVVAPPTPSTPRTPGLGPRIGGAKSKKACEEYKRSKVKLNSVIPLILFGEDTALGEFPHMALLGYRQRGGQQLLWACGGTLISDRYVLTAAHCLRGRDGPPQRVRLGEHDTSDSNDGAKDFGVESVIIHPEYGRTNSKSWYHDIGLIRLDKKVVFTSLIFPACLYAQSEEVVNNLIITGWGSTEGDGSALSNVLQKGKGTLVLVPAQECNTHYPLRQLGQRLANGIQPGMFCATDPNGQVDTCQGDSGGPIQISTPVERDVSVYHVVGVTCSGPSFCGDSPAIYSKVYFYLDWIETQVWT